MLPAPPSGWDALQERAKRAKTSEELSRIIAEMNALLREHEALCAAESGLAPYPEKHHGDHACVFYDSEGSLMEFLVRYFAEGLRKGEYCFAAQEPGPMNLLLQRLHSSGLEVERALHRGAFEIHTVTDTYFAGKRFDPRAMMETLGRAVDRAKTERFTGLRTAGDLSWAPTSRTLWGRALHYEELVAQFIPGKAITSVCHYKVAACTPVVMESLVKVHTSHLRLPR